MDFRKKYQLIESFFHAFLCITHFIDLGRLIVLEKIVDSLRESSVIQYPHDINRQSFSHQYCRTGYPVHE
jgi:hypothetical protein